MSHFQPSNNRASVSPLIVSAPQSVKASAWRRKSSLTK